MNSALNLDLPLLLLNKLLFPNTYKGDKETCNCYFSTFLLLSIHFCSSGSLVDSRKQGSCCAFMSNRPCKADM